MSETNLPADATPPDYAWVARQFSETCTTFKWVAVGVGTSKVFLESNEQ